MRRTVFFVAVAIAPLVAGRAAMGDERAAPRIDAVAAAMERFVKDREIAGAVTVVADSDRILHLHSTGMADIAAEKPMRPDTILWIASMTKPIAGTAVAMLVEEGKLSIEDPVEKHLPEFAKLKDRDANRDGKPARVTIRHLLTHTSGMAEISRDEAAKTTDLAGLVPLYVEKPVAFAPGSRWAYCQSSINTAARIVEVASGKSFVDFLDERLFRPLGMKDTTFYLTDAQLSRLAKTYTRTKAGELEEGENFVLLGKSPTSRDRFPAANGGLFSTANDYVRFCQMIVRGGEYGGKQLLKPESVRAMTAVLTGDLKTGFTDGNGWGLGWCVVRKPQGPTAMLSPGTFGHGGAHGTQAWIDPEKKRVYLLMVQRTNFPNADASDVRQAFQAAAAESLDGGR
jgi:CubicO group peptidase (beta-lactamase class C family)